MVSVDVEFVHSFGSFLRVAVIDLGNMPPDVVGRVEWFASICSWLSGSFGAVTTVPDRERANLIDLIDSELLCVFNEVDSKVVDRERDAIVCPVALL